MELLELDETGEPPAFGFARLLNARTRRNSFRLGRLNYSASVGPASRAIEVALNLNRDLGVAVSAVKNHGATRAMAGYFSKRAR